MIEDRLLVLRLQHGDTKALMRIYDKYAGALLGIAVKMVHNFAVAEDLLHDIFLDFVEGIMQFRLTGSLKSYLACCVANRAKDWLRSSERHAFRSFDFDGLRSPERTPDRIAMEDEMSLQVSDALNQLPMEQKEAILLHLLGGVRFREIAAIQGVSINTVQGRYRYGIAHLKHHLSPEVGNEVCRECRTIS